MLDIAKKNLTVPILQTQSSIDYISTYTKNGHRLRSGKVSKTIFQISLSSDIENKIE